jgi:hypothetical protein
MSRNGNFLRTLSSILVKVVATSTSESSDSNSKSVLITRSGSMLEAVFLISSIGRNGGKMAVTFINSNENNVLNHIHRLLNPEKNIYT